MCLQRSNTWREAVEQAESAQCRAVWCRDQTLVFSGLQWATGNLEGGNPHIQNKFIRQRHKATTDAQPQGDTQKLQRLKMTMKKSNKHKETETWQTGDFKEPHRYIKQLQRYTKELHNYTKRLQRNTKCKNTKHNYIDTHNNYKQIQNNKEAQTCSLPSL